MYIEDNYLNEKRKILLVLVQDVSSIDQQNRHMCPASNFKDCSITYLLVISHSFYI